MKAAIQQAILGHNVALPLLVAGFAGIVAEFLRPGRAWPGALGGVLFALGAWGLANAPAARRLPFAVVASVALALLAMASMLLAIAWRGWLNKAGPQT